MVVGDRRSVARSCPTQSRVRSDDLVYVAILHRTGYLAGVTVRGMVFFDIDGTLVRSMSSGSFLAARLGHQKVLDNAELRYAAGELTNEQVSVIDAEGWRGIDADTVDCWLEPRRGLESTRTPTTWSVCELISMQRSTSSGRLLPDVSGSSGWALATRNGLRSRSECRSRLQ